MHAAASARWAVGGLLPTERMAFFLAALNSCVANPTTWAGPLTRPTSEVGTLLLPVPLARWAVPERPKIVVACPCCGHEVEERRLAGPGLGFAVTLPSAARAKGPKSLRCAALPSIAVDGGREQRVMLGTPRGTRDKPLCLRMLLWLLLSFAGDRRREEKSPSI